MRRVPAFLFGLTALLVAGVALSPAARADTHTYRATLVGGNEVPPNASPATGSVVVVIDDVTNEICQYQLIEDLSGPATAMHIHQGAGGVNGPIVVPFTAGSPSECVTADASVVSAIVAAPADHYFNVHTTAFPGGEIRGQLEPVVLSASPFTLEGTLSGGAEVPPNASPTTGPVAVLADPNTNLVCVLFTLENQDIANVTAMHIHQAPAGASGPVVIPFPVGTEACALADATVVAGLQTSPAGFYVNLHTAAFPDGEARAQLAFPAAVQAEDVVEAPAAEPVAAQPRYTG